MREGYAVAGTDDGHQDKVGTNASWALGHPEKVVDFGWRALKETTDISKALIVAKKGGKIAAVLLRRLLRRRARGADGGPALSQ